MNELELTEKKIINAANIITKDYLGQLDSCEPVWPSAEDLDIDISECGSFYRLKELVLDKEENFLDKLITIVNVIYSLECSLITIIKSDGYNIDYYLGSLSKNVRGVGTLKDSRRAANTEAFKGALTGNLTGSDIEWINPARVKQFKKEVLLNEKNCYSSISGVVSLRDDRDKSIEGYVQGIEKLTDSLKGQQYTILMVADPVRSDKLQRIRQGYEILHTELSTFEHTAVTLNEGDTYALSKAQTEGIAEGISKGIAMTQSRTDTRGMYLGGSMNFGFSLGLTAGMGINAGMNKSNSKTTGTTETTMNTRQSSKSFTDTVSSSKTEGKSIQLNYHNRSVKSLLDKIDQNLKRLDECESLGAFDCAAYVIADQKETVMAAAVNYNALMKGSGSGVQTSHINWYGSDNTKVLNQYMGSMVHPRFYQDKSKSSIVSPASILSGNELAIQIGLPKKSVTGISVVEKAAFGRNIMPENDNTIPLGNLYHMGQDEKGKNGGQKVSVDLKSLTMHTFVTGSTGSGKSTTIYSVLDKLIEKNISFLVIEPAKGEYKDRFGSYKNVKVYGTNYKKTPLLRINPFSFPEDVHVLEHIDRLIEIFNVCWPMYAAMPAVLKDAIERSYSVAGWNLETSENRYTDVYGKPLYPSFMDVLNQIHTVMEESAYSSESKSDYRGALSTRIKSLTNGLYGQIFTNDELTGEELFDTNVIVDLSRVGSMETRSLLMGLLVIKLQEYRMSKSHTANRELHHITVLEEAHNLLKRTSTEQIGEGANLLGKSVEMLANSIAEMRTYGEGFVIADQAPGLMDPSVIRNTNTKIILRLPDQSDRMLAGKAAGLNDEQITELSKLPTFVAAVYQNDWPEAVLCNVKPVFKEYPDYQYEFQQMEKNKTTDCLTYLLMPYKRRKELDHATIEKLRREMYELSVASEFKADFIKVTEAYENEESEEMKRSRRQIIYHLFNTDLAFEQVKNEENTDRLLQTFAEALKPDLRGFTKIDQKKCVAVLLREKAESERNEKFCRIFESFMKHV